VERRKRGEEDESLRTEAKAETEERSKEERRKRRARGEETH
jgi:hypothetical protein